MLCVALPVTDGDADSARVALIELLRDFVVERTDVAEGVSVREALVLR